MTDFNKIDMTDEYQQTFTGNQSELVLTPLPQIQRLDIFNKQKQFGPNVCPNCWPTVHQTFVKTKTCKTDVIEHKALNAVNGEHMSSINRSQHIVTVTDTRVWPRTNDFDASRG